MTEPFDLTKWMELVDKAQSPDLWTRGLAIVRLNEYSTADRLKALLEEVKRLRKEKATADTERAFLWDWIVANSKVEPARIIQDGWNNVREPS